jgi:hypothetical protein
MAGTLIAYHCPTRQIKVKCKNYTINTKTKTFKVNIKILTTGSLKNNNKEGTKSVFHRFCPGLPELLTLCPIK